MSAPIGRRVGMDERTPVERETKRRWGRGGIARNDPTVASSMQQVPSRK
jgi:hypothetical protein